MPLARQLATSAVRLRPTSMSSIRRFMASRMSRIRLVVSSGLSVASSGKVWIMSWISFDFIKSNPSATGGEVSSGRGYHCSIPPRWKVSRLRFCLPCVKTSLAFPTITAFAYLPSILCWIVRFDKTQLLNPAIMTLRASSARFLFHKLQHSI